MDRKTVAGESAAQRWRTFCQQHADKFDPIRGTAATRQRIERLEEMWSEQLAAHNLPLDAQAVAFRSIMKLRGCSGRDVATFFGLSPQVIARGLSLLEMPASRLRHLVPPTAATLSLGVQAHTKAA